MIRKIYRKVYRKVYLAHSPTELERGRKVLVILERNTFKVFNPFEESVNRGLVIKPQTPATTDVSVVWRDLGQVLESDLVVCLYPEKAQTIGIPCEMFMAWMYLTSVISFVPEKLLKHPWIVKMSKIVRIGSGEKIMEAMKELEEGA